MRAVRGLTSLYSGRIRRNPGSRYGLDKGRIGGAAAAGAKQYFQTKYFKLNYFKAKYF